MSSLKKLAIRGAAWSFLGYGASQVIRFGSNLVLSRLLVPEYFGLMALINVLIIGLALFSDIGIGPSIIQSKRGDDPTFLNTAWTIQVFRGITLWLCACIAAWPFAQFYNEPKLVWIIPVASLSAIVAGFNSTSLFTANRNLELGRLTVIEIAAQTGSTTVMVTWALITPSVWALVAGGMTASSIKMLSSHFWLTGIKHRLTWDQKSAQSLFRFGRWIFISTMMTFFINQSDRLILGKFMSLSTLGVYSYAYQIAQVVEQIYQRIKQQVLFPIYSKLNYLHPKELRGRVKKVRLTLMAALLPILWFLIILGPNIIDFLFDPRYKDAGWMLQILAAGWIVPMATDIGPFYLAYGNSFLMMQILAIRSILLLGGMIVGGTLAGNTGLICGIAFSQVLLYPFQVLVYRRYSLWIPELDALGVLGSVAVIAGGLWLMNMFAG